MKPPLRALIALLAAVAVVTAIVLVSGSSSPSRRTLMLRSVVDSHPCLANDLVMQCVLPPPRVGLKPRVTASLAYGVDFGWSGISAARAKALGARFGASYFSADSSKNWTLATVNAYHAVGLATVGVWESTATRSTEGAIAGAEDARTAKAQAAAVGNTARPVLFAIDCDCSASQIIGYFRGAHSVLAGRTDAYGGYSQVWAVYHAGYVGNENWQTYAWSRGGWLSSKIAPLEQYLNGSAFDNDRALKPAYAQWPYSPAPLLPVCYHHRITKSKCAAAKRQVASAQRGLSSSQRAYKAKGCPVLAQRISWYSMRLRQHPKFKATSRKKALSLSRIAYRQRSCSVFVPKRSGHFGALIARIEAAN
jgi:hypothetical protein